MAVDRFLGLFCFLVAVLGFQEFDEPIGPLRTRLHRTAEDEIARIEENKSRLLPTVFLALLASNQAHALPQFLAYIERQDYPKDRISIGFVWRWFGGIFAIRVNCLFVCLSVQSGSRLSFVPLVFEHYGYRGPAAEDYLDCI